MMEIIIKIKTIRDKYRVRNKIGIKIKLMMN